MKQGMREGAARSTAPAEEHAARVDALMGKYAHVPFSSEDLFRERQGEREWEEQCWKLQEL
jgi:hypothetical protein